MLRELRRPAKVAPRGPFVPRPRLSVTIGGVVIFGEVAERFKAPDLGSGGVARQSLPRRFESCPLPRQNHNTVSTIPSGRCAHDAYGNSTRSDKDTNATSRQLVQPEHGPPSPRGAERASVNVI